MYPILIPTLSATTHKHNCLMKLYKYLQNIYLMQNCHNNALMKLYKYLQNIYLSRGKKISYSRQNEKCILGDVKCQVFGDIYSHKVHSKFLFTVLRNRNMHMPVWKQDTTDQRKPPSFVSLHTPMSRSKMLYLPNVFDQSNTYTILPVIVYNIC